MYHNIKHQQIVCQYSELTASKLKSELHSKKFLLSVWWTVQGIIHWEDLPLNQTINAIFYCLGKQLGNHLVAETQHCKSMQYYHLSQYLKASCSCQKIITIHFWHIIHYIFLTKIITNNYRFYTTLHIHLVMPICYQLFHVLKIEKIFLDSSFHIIKIMKILMMWKLLKKGVYWICINYRI